MLKRQSRHLALLLVLTMLATMFVGVGVAQARSVNSVDKVIGVVDGKEYVGLNKLIIREDPDFVGQLNPGETFRVILPSGVEWHDFDNKVVPQATGIDPAGSKQITSRIAEFKIATTTIDIPLSFIVDGATGTLELTIEPMDSTVTAGTYVFARVGDAKMTATVDSVKNIGRSANSHKAGTIELTESALNAVTGKRELAGGNAEYHKTVVTVKLPSNFTWDEAKLNDFVQFGGGFIAMTKAANLDGVEGAAGLGKYWPELDTDKRTLTITFIAPDRTQRGSIFISPYIVPSRSAALGEVEVNIKANNQFDGSLFDGDLVVAEYVDWGITAKVKEVKELVAGKFDQETATITIQENIHDTLIGGRDLTVELPEWVKITDVKLTPTTAVTVASPKGDTNYIDFVVGAPSTSKKKIEFKLVLSIEGNQSGDIEASIFGAGVEEETTLVIATAIAPITASIDKVNEVKIGVQNQPLADLTIVEGKKGSIGKAYQYAPAKFPATINGKTGYERNDGGSITLTLTEGAEFSKTPTVTVTDGNLEIRQENVRADGAKVTIPIKSEGTKLSTIQVSDIFITCNRAIPEGELKIKVGGPAVIENHRDANSDPVVDAGEFVTASIPVVAATVVTPADPNVHAVSTFVIGSTVYQINGVDQPAMDQAPYIKNDRTYLPVRFVAYGLGIGDNGIIWDEIGRTVTLMKGDKVVQLKIGSTTLLVNGAAITMDTAPEITAAGRTCLPIRFVAEAFGAVVDWDAATQTTTITI